MQILRRSVAYVLLCAVMLGAVVATHAQDTNLLRNGGFEDGFTNLAGTQPRNVANNWAPWNAPRTDSMASFQNTQPKYLAAASANANGIVPRIRTGADAQIAYAFYETFDGGIFQQITGITPGTELRFSAYTYVWSTTYDDPNISDEPGSVAVRVGIDPTGGTDALSSNVIYSTPTVSYDAYRQSSIIVRATGSTVTVFIRASIGDPVQYSYVFVDDAVLAPTTVAAQPTATRPPATSTSAPTATRIPNSATPIPASATPLSPVTAAPTSTGIAATVPPTATLPSVSTVVPANTPVPNPVDATPTPEGGGLLLATATPFGLDATATAFAGGSTPVATAVDGATLVPTAVPTLNTDILEQFPGTIIHVVRRGDTVYDLAQLYGSAVEAVIVANDLNNNGFLQVGQRLIIPVTLTVPSVPTQNVVVTTAPGLPTPVPNTNLQPGTTLYTIALGDTLNSIARRFNSTAGTLVQLNRITNPNLIFAGLQLIVPIDGSVPLPQPTSAPVVTPTGPQTTYIAKPGDSLYRISLQFGRSIQAIATANNIQNFNRIFVGQVLVIP